MKNQFNQLITSEFDSRALELFINQNSGNQWLSADDVAGWMFETNVPDERELSIAIRFLNNVCVETLLGFNPHGILEKSTKTLTYKRGARLLKRTKPVYRLADPSMINEGYVPEPLEVTLDRASSKTQSKVKESWQTELDSLPF